MITSEGIEAFSLVPVFQLFELAYKGREAKSREYPLFQ